MKLRASLLTLAVMALCQSGAAAADPLPIGVAGMAETFRAICLEHLADPAAQVSEARGEPWQFVPDGQTDDHVDRYRSDWGALGIRATPRFCALTSELNSTVDVHGFEAAMAETLPLGQSRPLLQPDSVYWTIETDDTHEQYFIGLKVSSQSGRNLATFTLQKR